MYIENLITIDPSQLTKIEKIKPTKAFRKLLFSLTNGVVADKEEIETFNAISILQQICLLYTSPSPRDRQKSRMPSSA